MVLGSLSTVRLWIGPTCEMLPEQLMDYKEGISSIEPMFEPGKLVDEYDSRTGEITSLRPELADSLPGSTIKEKVQGFIAALPKDTTRVQTRDIIASETQEEKIEFFPWWNNGHIHGICWKLWSKDGSLFAEGFHKMDELWNMARSLGVDSKLMSLFKFPMEWRNG